jgi:hypothetical protein
LLILFFECNYDLPDVNEWNVARSYAQWGTQEKNRADAFVDDLLNANTDSPRPEDTPSLKKRGENVTAHRSTFLISFKHNTKPRRLLPRPVSRGCGAVYVLPGFNYL